MKTWFTKLKDWLVQDEPTCPDEPSWMYDTEYTEAHVAELEQRIKECGADE